jgi:hypothetical protein
MIFKGKARSVQYSLIILTAYYSGGINMGSREENYPPSRLSIRDLALSQLDGAKDRISI